MKVKIKFKRDYLTWHSPENDWVIKMGEILEVTIKDHAIFGPCYWYNDTLFWEKRELPVEELSNSLIFIIDEDEAECNDLEKPCTPSI